MWLELRFPFKFNHICMTTHFILCKNILTFIIQLHSDREIGTYVSDRYSYYAFQFLESVTPSSKRTLYDFSQLCSFSLCQSTVITRSDLFRRDIRRVLVTDFFGSVRHIIPGPVIEINNSTLYENNTLIKH
uniref:Putative GPI-anchor transamidase n=1 Tax=Schistosoma haematobium TaxID=6185 RepID=A0A095CFK1_SCHHA